MAQQNSNGKLYVAGALWQAKWESITKPLAIDVNSVVIDDNVFDTWVRQKLDVTMGPSATTTMAAMIPDLITLPDYRQMSRLFASAVGQGMMQFTQAVAPQAAVGAPLLWHTTTLNTGRELDRDQIAKLKLQKASWPTSRRHTRLSERAESRLQVLRV